MKALLLTLTTCVFFTALSAQALGPRDLSQKLKVSEPDSMEVLDEDFKNEKPAVVEAPKATDKESEIPVLTKAPVVKAETSNPFVRMIVALLAILGVGAGILIYAKRFKKGQNKSSPQTKIQVITQHYLGPKKSLAVIKIAGESILIGITDHNITPIRVLSLLDDELPAQTPQDFNAAMQHMDFNDENQDSFEFGARHSE